MHITSSNNLITFLSATAVVQKKKKKNIGFLEAYGKPIFCSRKIHFTSNCYYIFLKIYVQINQRKRCKTYSCRNFYFVATPPTHAERIICSWLLVLIAFPQTEEGVLLLSYVACPRDRNLFFCRGLEWRCYNDRCRPLS